MTDATTILADLILVITKCAIERSQLAELIALVVILALGSRCCLKLEPAISDCMYVHGIRGV
jgi:hypothetical protein